jgi:hypothetical protein
LPAALKTIASILSPKRIRLDSATRRQTRATNNTARSPVEIRDLFLLKRRLRKTIANISKGKAKAHKLEMPGINHPKKRPNDERNPR